MRRLVLGALAAVLLTFAAVAPARRGLWAQKMDSINRDYAIGILRDAHENVKKHYYDPKYHGVDLDARYHEYDGKIRNATNLGQAFRIVAAFLDGLNDTHTFFSPPARPYRIDDEYQMRIYGDRCFIIAVRPGSDAAAKLHPGDQVLQFNGYNVNRDDKWKMEYYFDALSPQNVSVFDLRDPAGVERKVSVEGKVREKKKVVDETFNASSDLWDEIREGENAEHLMRQRWINKADIMIWKMPEFNLAPEEVDHIFSDARKHKALILDLRGNPGGYEITFERMFSNIFDHDLKVGDRVGRKELKPLIAKSRGGEKFGGKLIVLVDSGSASSAEIFARVMQLEKRGTVIGDRSAGAVMEALDYFNSQGTDVQIRYAFSITEADLVMKDGKSLEHIGVTPDEIVLPTAKDLAEGRDPVMSRAAELAGLNLEPAAAGKLFPIEWLPD